MTPRNSFWAVGLGVAIAAAASALPGLALAQPTPPVVPQVSVSLGAAEGPEQVVPALKILLLLTVLTLAPAILISMTSFTRIVIVLSFIRQAMGTQNVPPMQVVLSLALMLTVVVMAPVGQELHRRALGPYMEEAITEEAAFEEAASVMRTFLLAHTRKDDLLVFHELTDAPIPRSPGEVALHLLVPAFLVSELRTGFEMGFLLFLPFVLVDLIVASVLTSMGMVMLPPTMVSTPVKLLLFVLVDGWSLLTRSLVASFG
ncbi:MAG TPA: flagellar type III secretion system pore protein FliP [Polyangiaceae bacterium LLY-WYZ-14_1]|nr:flagellar type III secretion system pore protein FliP [Polyangiaceae bacterium LLY-WYZ-14_1]